MFPPIVHGFVSAASDGSSGRKRVTVARAEKDRIQTGVLPTMSHGGNPVGHGRPAPRGRGAPVPARLLSVATAVPPHELSQRDAKPMAAALFRGNPATDHLAGVFDNAGVERRFSSVPFEACGRSTAWAARNRIYEESALSLLGQAADRALARAGVARHAVDAVVAVSTTGLATPSLDALLIERLGLREDAARLPVFGLGCAGGVIGLARAAELAEARPGRTVLLGVVELCSLTFRPADRSKGNFIATALFGDGAAAAVLRAGDAPGLAITASGEHTWPSTRDVMGWRFEDDGWAVVFSREIPDLIRARLRPALDRFLAEHGIGIEGFRHYALHPGGAKVLTALEAALDLPPAALDHARAVLRDYGNMSAATVLFVLERILANEPAGPTLLAAVGPGFSAGFVAAGC